MRRTYSSSTTLLALATTLLMSCGGGGGSSTPANPAQMPSPTASADLNGFWVCTESTLLATETVEVYPFEVGEVIYIFNGQLVGDVTNEESYLRADVELSLGFPLLWYTNVVNGSTLDFGLGYDMLGPGASEWDPDYLQYGLRFAATGPDQLIAQESAIEQWQAGAPRTQWTYGLTFQRTSSPEAAQKLYEAAMGAPKARAHARHWAARPRQAQ